MTEDAAIRIDHNSAECVHLDPLGLRGSVRLPRDATHNHDSL